MKFIRDLIILIIVLSVLDWLLFSVLDVSPGVVVAVSILVFIAFVALRGAARTKAPDKDPLDTNPGP